MSFCKVISDKDVLKKKYFNGIFSLIYNSKKYRVYIKFLFIKIAKISFAYGKANLKIFGFSAAKSRRITLWLLLPMLKDFVRMKSGDDKFDIIACFHRSGEAFLLGHHLNEYFKVKGISNPILVSYNKSLAPLIQMFYPDLKFVEVPALFNELHFLNIKNLNSGKNIRYFELLTYNHFVELEKYIQEFGDIHFYDAIKKRIGVKNSHRIYPVISEKTVKNALMKMQRIGLSKKFICIAPDAQSNGSLSVSFWHKLARQLLESGFDVLFNNIPVGMRNTYYKTCFFKLDEARYVAERAGAVVGIRSGLMDVVASAAKQIHCIYMPFTDRGPNFPVMSADKVQSAFSLTGLPEVNPKNISEYNAQELGEDLILEKILSNILEKCNELK